MKIDPDDFDDTELIERYIRLFAKMGVRITPMYKINGLSEEEREKLR